jgi:hypothetical protein
MFDEVFHKPCSMKMNESYKDLEKEVSRLAFINY